TKPIIYYLINVIKENKEDDCDKWYRNPFTFYYFYSRNVSKGIKELESVSPLIIERLTKKRRKNGCIGDSVLETALAISTLINLAFNGSLLTDAVAFLLNSQRETGEWARHLLYYSGPDKVVGWGSEELTTGFCIEALNSYLKQNDYDEV